MEVAKILPLLADAKDGPSFHVVAPSLPNFGFSDGVKKRGFSIPQYAETLHKVMIKLGYNKYGTYLSHQPTLINHRKQVTKTQYSYPRRRLGLRNNSPHRLPIPIILSRLPRQLYTSEEPTRVLQIPPSLYPA